MPVSDQAAHARDKGIPKFREKHKMGKFVKLLVYGALIMIISDGAFNVVNCAPNCPVRKCIMAYDFDENGREIPVYDIAPIQKYFLEMKPTLDYEHRIELLLYALRLFQDNLIRLKILYKIPLVKKQQNTAWNGHSEGADPTRNKNATMNEDVFINIPRILDDFALYEDQDAMNILFSDGIAYDHKAMFDSGLTLPSV